MVDPVMQDLNAHLNREAREDSRAEAEKAKLEEWMTDSNRIEEAWNEILGDENGIAPIDVAIALTCHKDDRVNYAMQLLDTIESKVRDQLMKDVPDAVTREERQNEEDVAVDRHEARMDDHG